MAPSFWLSRWWHLGFNGLSGTPALPKVLLLQPWLPMVHVYIAKCPWAVG